MFAVWCKYEEIAMHFNNLIMKIRLQALGGVATISTVVGLWSRNNTNDPINWYIAMAVFFFLILFWVAIWILDFKYYTRLLLGTVAALTKLEEESEKIQTVQKLNLSTMIEDAVEGKLFADEDKAAKGRRKKRAKGRWLFYFIVFGALIFCFGASSCMAFKCFDIANECADDSRLKQEPSVPEKTTTGDAADQ